MEIFRKKVEKQEEGVRLDAFLSALSGLTRSRVLRLHQQGNLFLNGEPPAKLGVKLREGDEAELHVPKAAPLEAQPTPMELSILYEDACLAVINKPRGLVVHPAAGHQSDTLVNGLLHGLSGLSGIGGVRRPGIVHRLDKDTTGLLVVAKDDQAHVSLSEQIRQRTAGREYLALIEGHLPKTQGVVDAPVGRSPKDRKKMTVVAGGRPAKTHYFELERFSKVSLVRFKLETGRTHQIRVHMQSLGHPVCGDPIYGFSKSGAGKCPLMLHAQSLSFLHPRTGEPMRFEAPLPEDFVEVLQRQR